MNMKWTQTHWTTAVRLLENVPKCKKKRASWSARNVVQNSWNQRKKFMIRLPTKYIGLKMIRLSIEKQGNESKIVNQQFVHDNENEKRPRKSKTRYKFCLRRIASSRLKMQRWKLRRSYFKISWLTSKMWLATFQPEVVLSQRVSCQSQTLSWFWTVIQTQAWVRTCSSSLWWCVWCASEQRLWAGLSNRQALKCRRLSDSCFQWRTTTTTDSGSNALLWWSAA